MSTLQNFFEELYVLFSYPRNIILLLSRIVIAYGFLLPVLLKINDIQGTVTWFGSISIPFPLFFAYLVTGLEAIGIILLVLGLFTRYISILLAFVMIGAIVFVHLAKGFSAGDGGFEIPMYYLIFLMIFATFGAGKYSLDSVLLGGSSHE